MAELKGTVVYAPWGKESGRICNRVVFFQSSIISIDSVYHHHLFI
jgi:hypothetical protein